jgi:hypothetical protein
MTVSSSGLDRPLKFLRQYRKNLGKELAITPLTGEPVSGILVTAEESGIELDHPVKNPKKEIKKENVDLLYSRFIISVYNVPTSPAHFLVPVPFLPFLRA